MGTHPIFESDFDSNRMKPIVQYVVVRRDLNWPLGALMAQACHAAVAATHLHYTHQHTQDYLGDLDNMHKVVLGAKSRAHLEKLAAKLGDKEIDFKLWVEQPEDYPTCLALRPYPKEDVQKLFKGFNLLKAQDPAVDEEKKTIE